MGLRWRGLVALLPGCNAFWDVNEKYMVTLAEGVQVYTHPGVDFETSSRYQFGEVFVVLDHDHSDGHEFVRTEAGWINIACHETSEHIAEKVSIVDPGEMYVSTSSEGLLVQSGPSLLSARVRIIPQGELFHIIERSLNEHGVIRLRIKEGGWVSDVNMQDGNLIAEPVVPKTPERHIVSCPRGLIVRSDPDLSSEIVGWLRLGETCEVFERAVVGDGTIRLRTTSGWISQVSQTTGTAITTRMRSCDRPVALEFVDNSNITESDGTSIVPDFLDAFMGYLGDNESAEELVLEANFADGTSMVVSTANAGVMSFGATASESQTADASFFSSLEDNACFWKNCGAKVVDSVHQKAVEANSVDSVHQKDVEANSADAALTLDSSSGVKDGTMQVHDASTDAQDEDNQPFFTLSIDHPDHVKQLEATIAVHKAVYQGQDSTRIGFHRYRSDSVWRYNPCNGKPMAVRESPHIASQKTNSYKFPGETFAVDQTLEDDAVRFLRLADGSGWLFDQTPTCRLCEPVSGWIVKQKGLDQERNRDQGGSLSSARLHLAEVEVLPMASNYQGGQHHQLPLPAMTVNQAALPVASNYEGGQHYQLPPRAITLDQVATPKPLSQFPASNYPTANTMTQMLSQFTAANSLPQSQLSR